MILNIDLAAVFGQQIAALLGLIMLDVLLGVARAIAQRRFDWSQLANFYRTNVIPYVIGWVAFSLFVKVAAPEVLGPEFGGLAGETVPWVAWLFVVAAIGRSIVANAQELYQGAIAGEHPAGEHPGGEPEGGG